MDPTITNLTQIGPEWFRTTTNVNACCHKRAIASLVLHSHYNQKPGSSAKSRIPSASNAVFCSNASRLFLTFASSVMTNTLSKYAFMGATRGAAAARKSDIDIATCICRSWQAVSLLYCTQSHAELQSVCHDVMLSCASVNHIICCWYMITLRALQCLSS